MASTFGKSLQVSVFGESHGVAIGAVADSFPPGEKIDLEALQKFCARRRPGQKLTTPRSESDAPEILSGVVDGVTTGTPLGVIIRNQDKRSSDYQNLADIPRPGHADMSSLWRYGQSADRRGGGHFSGRLTAPLVFLGGIALQILAKRNIFVGAHLLQAGGIADEKFPEVDLSEELLSAPGKKAFPVLSDECGEKMQQYIAGCAAQGDSCGGIVECAVTGFPAGVGSPIFDGIENRLSSALFGIPAVKGVSFGAGFSAADSCGSANNDSFVFNGGKIATKTNHCGGVLGGISTGMPIIFSAAFKPTPSIALAQQSIDLSSGKAATCEVEGRHDPCVAIRAVPVVEAVAALVLLDMLMSERTPKL